MSDMLNTAVSGLLSFQRSLATTSHNIANVNTEGYSRQRVEMEANPATFLGGNYYGTGVNIESVTRAYDQFLTMEVRNTTSSHSRLDLFSDLTAYIDDVLADPQGGVSPMLHQFFGSVQDVADDPLSVTARTSMLYAAQALTGRFESLDTRFQELSQNTMNDVRNRVDDINQLVLAVRDVNLALGDLQGFGGGTQQAADLLDQRDKLLGELSEKVDISVIDEQGTNLTIFIGNGQTVLSGTEVFSLTAQPSGADPDLDVITYNGLITVFDISDQLSGGELGGLLDFRKNVLQPTRNALGRSAIGLAETFNAQMRDGMDLNGNLGQDFFSYTGPQSIDFASNPGTPTVTTVVSDATALTTDDYHLAFDGVNWTLTSDSGSSASVVNGAPATLVFEGLTLTIDGATAVAGDQFTIKPTLAGAGSFQLITTDASEIAAAVPIRTLSSLNNLGDVAISPGIVTDVTDLNLLNTVTFTFDNPATTFRADADVIVGGVPYLTGAAIPYSNSMVIDANGWQVSLTGSPQAGDLLTVESNAGGGGDNRNALDLAGLQNIGVFDGGVASYQEDYGNLIGLVGSQAQSAGFERDAHQILLSQAVDRRHSKSSVNLDEEAAELVRFQQAYEASARIITVAQTMFDTLIDSLR